jgi:hypothetical protein
VDRDIACRSVLTLPTGSKTPSEFVCATVIELGRGKAQVPADFHLRIRLST